MAYRKIGGRKRKSAPKRKSGGRRRRRMSGIGAVDLASLGETVLGVGAGAVVARVANTLQTSVGLNLSPTIMGLIQIAGGAWLTTTKNNLMKFAGYGAIGTGVTVEAVALGLISGVPGNRTYQINGTSNLAVVGKMNRLPRVAGTDQLSVVAGQPNNRIANPSRKFNGVF